MKNAVSSVTERKLLFSISVINYLNAYIIIGTKMLFYNELLKSRLKFIMGFLPLTVLISFPAYKNLKKLLYISTRNQSLPENNHIF